MGKKKAALKNVTMEKIKDSSDPASFHTRANLSAKQKSGKKSRISLDIVDKFSVGKRAKPQELEFVYVNYPLAFQGVNVITTGIVSTGYVITHDRPKVVKDMKEWRDKVNFDEKLHETIINALVYGNGYMEIVFDDDSETIDDLIVLDSRRIDFQRDVNGDIIFDDDGNPKGYVEKTSEIQKEGDTKFEPNQIAHYAFYKLGGKKLGISILQPVIRSIADGMNIDRAITAAIERHGFAQYDITVGNETSKPTQAQIDSIANDVTDLQVTNEYVHSNDVKVEVLEAKNTRSYDGYNDTKIQNTVSGMGVPAPLILGTGESSNKSTAGVQSKNFAAANKTKQLQIKSVTEDSIFKLLMELNNWTDFPRMEWNVILSEEESEKIARTATLFEQGIISRTEARETIGLPQFPDYGDFKPSTIAPPMPQIGIIPQMPGQQPKQPGGTRQLPERTGPKPKMPQPPEKSTIPPFKPDVPSERGRAALSELSELNELKSNFRESLNHYFDTLRSDTINKIVSIQEFANEGTAIIPLDRLSKELEYNLSDLSMILYAYMKEGTKMGLKESGALSEEDNALLSSSDADYLNEFVDILAKKEMDGLFNKLKWEIINSFGKHEKLDKISEKINSEFAKFTSFGTVEGKQVKSELIANTEANRAFNNGLIMGFSKKGIEFLSRHCTECDGCSKCNLPEHNKLSLADARGKFPLHPGCNCSLDIFQP